MSGGTIWGKTNFGKNKIFHQFCFLGGNVSNFLQRKVSRVFKIALHVSRWTFRGTFSRKKNIFSLSPPDFEQTTMGLFEGRNQHGLQNCILRLQRNILRIFLINASFLFITFRLLPQKKSNFWRQKCGILAKMQSGWPAEHFEKKTTFLKIIFTIICPSRTFSDFQPIFFRT